MLNDLYPRLRRLGVSVDYEVREVENAEAAKLIYTDPKLLSLQEMYRVAKDLKPEPKNIRKYMRLPHVLIRRCCSLYQCCFSKYRKRRFPECGKTS